MKNVQKCFFHTSEKWKTCPHKKKLIFKEMLLLKTNFRMKGERRQMLEWKKNEEISKVLYVLSFGLQLEMKLVQTVFISIGVKIRQALYT